MLLELYRQMFLIRLVEENLLALFSKGRLSGTIHTYIGQEVCAVGVISALDKARDIIWSNHRGHGHFLAWTGDAQGLISEILGRASGVCGGIGGSQHLHADRFYSNGVLGGTIACAVGSAFAEKHNRSGTVVAAFMGDGALGEGIVYESFNIASLWSLPVLFVLEDNGYAQTTPKRFEHAGDIGSRTTSFSIQSTRLEARCVTEVLCSASQIVAEIRSSSRPHMLALETSRIAPHSKGDDTRDPEELARLRAADPLAALRNELIATHPDLEAVETEVREAVNNAIAAAESSPFASLSSVGAS